MTDQKPALSDAAKAMLDADVASATLGITVSEAKDGRAVARMRVTERMVNGHGIAHGGYVFLFADTTFAAACNSHGPVTVAAGADISFVASARLGDELVASGPLLSDDGRVVLGAAVLLEAPHADAAREVLPDGRYVGVEVHQWQFGGRPG